MTAATPQDPQPRHGDSPEEQPRPDQDVEREEPSPKSEEEMTPGKDYPLSEAEPALEYDPATRRTPQGGGPD